MRESVFTSLFRALFRAFGAIIGIFLAIIAGAVAINALSDNVDLPKKSELTVAADANGKRKLLGHTAPVILRININGVIGVDNLTADKFTNMLYDSREDALANDRVKGIFLHINSPGGLATDSSDIYNLLKAYKQKFNVPIYVFVDGMCASGGMYIACAADKIFSTSDSIIGSVGVRLGPAFNVYQAMDKLGISALTLTEGKNKDALNPFRPWKDGEDAAIRDVLAKSYDQFVNVVTTARPGISRSALVDNYGAQIYIAQDAEKYGYIDVSNSDYNSCLTALVEAAGIHKDIEYQVLLIEPHFSVVENFSKSQSNLMKGRIEHTIPGIQPEMSGKLLYLYTP